MALPLNRALSLIEDINITMASAAAAVDADDLDAVHAMVSSLHARTSAWQHLPAHHQRRRVMDDLGFINLDRIRATFASLTDSTSGLTFIDDELDVIPDSTVYARLCRRSSADFYEHTRLTTSEFLILYQELRPFIIQPRESDFRSPLDAAHLARHSHRLLHPIDELLLWLYHADGNKHTVLCLLFDIDRTTVNVITDHITHVINHVWEREVKWPSAEERAEQYGLFSCFEKAVGCIDGTHCRIDVPDDEEEENDDYSGYKHYHTQNYLLCCNAYGFIIHVAGPFPGSWNDKQCFLVSDFMNPDLHMLNEDERLITDGGFAGFSMNIHPYTAAELEEATDEERTVMVAWNEELTLNRSLNEHVNHQVKARAQALAGKWSRSKLRQRDMVLCAARFTNRLRRLRIEYRLYCLQLSIEAATRPS